MRIYNFRYLIYGSAAAFCLAWAISGWLAMSTAGDISLPTVSAGKQKAKKPVLPDTDMITSKNIFKARLGELPVTVNNSAESTASVPVSTTFKGVLLGVLTGDKKAMAVIDMDGKKYILQQDVEQEGITLIETGFYHAVIKYKGKEHKLVLQMPDEAKLTSGASKQKGQYPKQVSGGSSSQIKGQNLKISRAEVVKNLSDVNEVIKSILIVPYEKDGVFQGYRVRRMARDSVLLKLGIKRNDVIMRLNGKSLETPTVFFDALKNAENLSAVTIDIQRQKERITNYVEIEG